MKIRKDTEYLQLVSNNQGFIDQAVCMLKKAFSFSDDEVNSTSLSNTDLYTDTYEKIRNIVNLKKHPYTFYQKQGYKIVGVLPDVNGIGKPDILIAKRL